MKESLVSEIVRYSCIYLIGETGLAEYVSNTLVLKLRHTDIYLIIFFLDMNLLMIMYILFSVCYYVLHMQYESLNENLLKNLACIPATVTTPKLTMTTLNSQSLCEHTFNTNSNSDNLRQRCT